MECFPVGLSTSVKLSDTWCLASLTLLAVTMLSNATLKVAIFFVAAGKVLL